MTLCILYNVTTNYKEKGKLEEAMNILKGHRTFLTKEKQLLETSVDSVSRLLTDLERKGPQYVWVLISHWAEAVIPYALQSAKDFGTLSKNHHTLKKKGKPFNLPFNLNLG